MAKNLKNKQTNKQIFNKHTTKCKIIQIMQKESPSNLNQEIKERKKKLQKS